MEIIITENSKRAKRIFLKYFDDITNWVHFLLYIKLILFKFNKFFFSPLFRSIFIINALTTLLKSFFNIFCFIRYIITSYIFA